MFMQEDFPLIYIPGYMVNVSTIWEKVLFMAKRYDFKKNDILRTKNSNNSFWYIKSGLMAFYSEILYSNNEDILYLIGPGVLALEGYNSTRYNLIHISRTVALKNITLYEFNRDILYDKDFMENYIELIKNYTETMSIKFVSHVILQSIRNIQSSIQKISYFIYGFYLLNNKKTSFIPPISQKVLAQLAGVSTYTINRAINKLKKMNILIYYTKTKMALNNIPLLKALAYDSI